jgi:F-type H+-transporting ATPase subunit epsilon
MATFHFDVVSPDKVLFSGEVNRVDVPGSEGDFGVLAAHTKSVTKLRPGILVVHSERGALQIVVDGGFAEVAPSRLSVFADRAVSSTLWTSLA